MIAHSTLRRLGVAGLVLTVIGLTAVPATAVTGRGSSSGHWDPRLRPIAEKVAALRDLDFEHPVAVRFLADADFERRQRADRSDLSKRDEQDLQRTQAQLRALGLIGAGVDLFEANNDIRASGVAAYYDPKTERITVKGKGPLDAATKVIVAHELTHALQDQHFDLSRIDRIGVRHHASSVTRAVVEGDAVRIQNLYRADLPKKQQDAAAAQESAAANAQSDDTPDVLLAIFQAPYAFGPAMVQAGAKRRGGIDGLFRSPPTTDLALLTPSTLLDDVHVTRVPRPGVTATEKVVGKPDVFGAFALYLVLGSRLGPQTALEVADGWGGDSMISFERDGHTCLRSALVGRDDDRTAAISRTLSEWAAAMPAGSATVVPRSGKVILSVCDTGAVAPAPAHGAAELVAFAAVRDTIYAGLVGQGQPSDVATCTADRFVRDRAFAPLLAAPNEEPEASVVEALRPRAREITQECAAAAAK